MNVGSMISSSRVPHVTLCAPRGKITEQLAAKLRRR